MTADVEVTVERPREGVALAALIGDLDQRSGRGLHDRVADIVRDEPTYLVLDLSNIGFCDSTGLSVLIGIWHLMHQSGGSVAVVGVPTRLQRMLTLTGVDELLPVHPTAADAVRAGPAGLPAEPGFGSGISDGR
ncbi:STAS domain-containing protein [Streptomyces sp. NPDC006184]|uniref:STAS domain-containing protein n=1 Tax=Streptomyces sp. NPDC006184 TaxID=3155455 RepID=UPI0033A4C0EE